MGDDANFATTTANSLGNRVRVDTSSQGLSNTEKTNARTNIGAQVAGSYASSSHNHDGTYAPASHNHDLLYNRYIPAVEFNNAYSGTYDTSDFISELEDRGCFNNNHVSMKVNWSYAGNRDLDTGDGTLELAGCVIETWGQGSYKHVRITRPNTGTGGPSVWEYNDQGSSYAPGWRRFWTDRDFEISDYYTKSQIDAKFSNLYSA